MGHMEASVLSSQIFCKSKTIVKLKVYFKKEIPILRMKRSKSLQMLQIFKGYIMNNFMSIYLINSMKRTPLVNTEVHPGRSR